MSQETKNLAELAKFERANATYFTQEHNGNLRFTARVSFPSSTVSEELEGVIQKTSWEFGNIFLADGEAITAESYHTEFIPKFNTWKYSGNGTLVISGTSPKLGRYTAEITPV